MEGGSREEAGRLAWRCRRGMKELDLLLLDYLQRNWPQASAIERDAFARILELPDPVLMAYLVADAHCADDSLAPLVATLQQLAAQRPRETALDPGAAPA